MRSQNNLQYFILVIVILLAFAGCGAPTATPIPPTPTSPPATGTPIVGTAKVDVGGYGLYIKCFGEGSPTVVLDSGWGATLSDWNQVTWRIKPQTPIRVCAYNRAGLGGSDPAPKKPRTNQDMARDLRALLTNANIPGPYVLVAHSMAGFTARLFASLYPQDVVGMVLVDTDHPDRDARLLALLPPESPDESEAVKNFRQEMAAIVDDPMEMPEYYDFTTSAAQVRAAGSLGSIHLVVLTQDLNDLERHLRELKTAYGSDFPPELAGSFVQEVLRMQQELAELSSNSTLIIVEGSSHLIPQDQPDAVVDAILQVVDAVRGE